MTNSIVCFTAGTLITAAIFSAFIFGEDFHFRNSEASYFCEPHESGHSCSVVKMPNGGIENENI